MGKESICCGTALWSEVQGARCDEFCRATRGVETACPISPDSILPIAHYWQNQVNHIGSSRAQERL